MDNTILITAAVEDIDALVSQLELNGTCLLHTPLEVYKIQPVVASQPPLKNLDEFENIVYASKRNAQFFIQQVEAMQCLESVQQRLNLAFDEATFAYLGDHDIAAIYPQQGTKATDVLELLMRLDRLDATLYPCGSHQREDLPGLLYELDIPVSELPVFNLEGPGEEAVQRYQHKLSAQEPSMVVFHSRRSVNRTLAAFPDLSFREVFVIAADEAITHKLQQKNITTDAQACGSWSSIASIINKKLL